MYACSLWQCSIIWLLQQTSPYIVNLKKTRILDNYYQSLYANINNTSKLETYCLLKHTFGFEVYLDFIKIKKLRISLTHFCVSSHDLNIEVGRYTNITRNQRICTNCSMNMLECEYHFYLFAPNTETYKLFFPHFTFVIGQLIINSNHYYVKTQNLYKKREQNISIMHINFET